MDEFLEKNKPQLSYNLIKYSLLQSNILIIIVTP